MTYAQFDTTKKPLTELLSKVESGALQLPDFQRGWVWDDAGIRSLLASISQSFPVGALMTLETGGEVRFKPRPIEGAPDGAWGRQPEELLLDGQQRMTSLYQATRRQEVVHTINAQRRTIQRWYYIDMEAALDPEVDREDAILGLPEDKRITRDFGRQIVLDLSSPHLEYTYLKFPANRIFDTDSWQIGFFAHWNYDAEKIKFWFEFQNRIIAAFKQYYLPVITLGRETQREAVCLVFEKVNTGGKKLDAFELLTAIYATDSFDLRKDWLGTTKPETGEKTRRIGRFERLAKHKVLREVKSTDFLQAVTLLHTLQRRLEWLAAGQAESEAPPVRCTRDALLNLPLPAYQKLADKVEMGFIRVAKFLWSQRIYAQKDVPYQTQLVPLAAVLAIIGDRWEQAAVRKRIARWYWCGVLGELYGSAVETRYARDLLEVPPWLDGGDEPATVLEATFRVDRLDTMRSRLSAAYKGVHALLIQAGARDFRSGQTFDQTNYFEENVDIHHIFPRAFCERLGVPASRYDTIVNKTPLSAKTNRIIGGGAPSTYLNRLRQELDARTLDMHLESHAIEPDRLRDDDFEAFYAARRQSLLVLVETAMGKSAYRGQTADEREGEVIEEDSEQLLEAAE